MQAEYAKELPLLAKVLPHMFARWRLPLDLETLAALPDGLIRIDALAGTARHETAGPLELVIAKEMRAGLESRLLAKGISRVTLGEAGVTVEVDTTAVRTDRDRIVHFDFRIACRILAEGSEFLASQEENHVWHDRLAGPLRD